MGKPATPIAKRRLYYAIQSYKLKEELEHRGTLNTGGQFLKGSIGGFALKKAQISGVSR
jgi:hypothetical protein